MPPALILAAPAVALLLLLAMAATLRATAT